MWCAVGASGPLEDPPRPHRGDDPRGWMDRPVRGSPRPWPVRRRPAGPGAGRGRLGDPARGAPLRRHERRPAHSQRGVGSCRPPRLGTQDDSRSRRAAWCAPSRATLGGRRIVDWVADRDRCRRPERGTPPRQPWSPSWTPFVFVSERCPGRRRLRHQVPGDRGAARQPEAVLGDGLADPDPDHPVRRVHRVPVPGAHQRREPSGWPVSARPTRRSGRRPNGCPSAGRGTGRTSPRWPSLNRNLGSLPLQAGQPRRAHHRATATRSRQMTEAVDAPRPRVEVEFYITAWDDLTAPFFEALVAATERGVTVRLLFDHLGSRGIPGYKEFVARLEASDIEWHPMLPMRPLKGSSSGPTCATTARSSSSTGGSPSWARRTSPSPATTSRRTTRRAGSTSSWWPASTGPAVATLRAVFAKDWFIETRRAHGRRIAPRTRDAPRRRRRRPGAAERPRLRHREQPAAVHRADLLGAAPRSR